MCIAMYLGFNATLVFIVTLTLNKVVAYIGLIYCILYIQVKLWIFLFTFF